MLDEIDKIGSDFRGDPASALLEVLDPDHNSVFTDHYLNVPYDLSRAMFITTANLLEPIQPAFFDRLEVIHLTGYTEDEKVAIAHRHLIPKLTREHGLKADQLAFTERAIRGIISDYTKEAGLRGFERELAAICRKVAVKVATGRRARMTVDREQLGRLLGAAKHYNEELLARDRVGVATGLAWTAAGGDLMFIEVVAIPGKGELLLTGQLGEVMKESAQAALSFARSYAGTNGLSRTFFAEHDIHVHVPAGSIPKDGPSAGITIAAAIISVLTGRAVHRRVAMTGEITLRGDILPIGGVREKVMAARLAGVRTVVLPKLNQRDLAEVPPPIKQGLRFHFAEHLDEVLAVALVGEPPAAAAH
jgi:ATP-dependent Lon protease